MSGRSRGRPMTPETKGQRMNPAYTVEVCDRAGTLARRASTSLDDMLDDWRSLRAQYDGHPCVFELYRADEVDVDNPTGFTDGEREVVRMVTGREV